jgi:hypothetical protein
MRRHFQLIVARPWQGTVGANAMKFAAAFQCMEYVTSEDEFNARLCAVAPTSSHQILRGVTALEAPESRQPEDFTVQFNDEGSQTEPPTDRR